MQTSVSDAQVTIFLEYYSMRSEATQGENSTAWNYQYKIFACDCTKDEYLLATQTCHYI